MKELSSSSTDHCYEEYVEVLTTDVLIHWYPAITTPEACQDACRNSPSTCLSWIFMQSSWCILKGTDYHETRTTKDVGIIGGPRDCDCSLFP